MALKAGRVGVRPDQVDSTGKVISSGGGGGGVTIDTLATITDFTSDTIIPDISEYDLILMNVYNTYQNKKYYLSGIYDLDFVSAGDALAVYTESGYFTLTLKTKTSIGDYLINNFGSPYAVKLLGIKINQEV